MCRATKPRVWLFEKPPTGLTGTPLARLQEPVARLQDPVARLHDPVAVLIVFLHYRAIYSIIRRIERYFLRKFEDVVGIMMMFYVRNLE